MPGKKAQRKQQELEKKTEQLSKRKAYVRAKHAAGERLCTLMSQTPAEKSMFNGLAAAFKGRDLDQCIRNMDKCPDSCFTSNVFESVMEMRGEGASIEECASEVLNVSFAGARMTQREREVVLSPAQFYAYHQCLHEYVLKKSQTIDMNHFQVHDYVYDDRRTAKFMNEMCLIEMGCRSATSHLEREVANFKSICRVVKRAIFNVKKSFSSSCVAVPAAPTRPPKPTETAQEVPANNQEERLRRRNVEQPAGDHRLVAVNNRPVFNGHKPSRGKMRAERAAAPKDDAYVAAKAGKVEEAHAHQARLQEKHSLLDKIWEESVRAAQHSKHVWGS